MWQKVSKFNFNRCLVLSFTNNTNSKYLTQKICRDLNSRYFVLAINMHDSCEKFAVRLTDMSFLILISCYKCFDLKIIITLKCEYLKDRACRSTNDDGLDILVNCFFQPDWGNLRHFFKDCMVICQGKSIIRVRARYLSHWSVVSFYRECFSSSSIFKDGV